MTTKIIHRPARTVRPPQPQQPYVMNAPPRMPGGRSGFGSLAMAIPMVASVIAMAMMTMLRGQISKTMMIMGAVMIVVALLGVGVMSMSQLGQTGRQRREQRKLYLRYLEDLREEFGKQQVALRHRLHQCYPDTDRLLDLVHDPSRLWERRRSDPDFLRVRIGTGWAFGRDLSVPIDNSPTDPPDPSLVSEAVALTRRFGPLSDAPISVDLDLVGEVSLITPDYQQGVDLARVIMCQIAAAHAPDDVRMAVVADPPRLGQWSWANWLPHLLDPTKHGAAGPLLRMAPDIGSLMPLISDDIAERVKALDKNRWNTNGPKIAESLPRLVIINDCHGQNAAPLPIAGGRPLADLGITVIRIVADRVNEPGEIGARITVVPPTSWGSPTESGSMVQVEQFVPGQYVIRGRADRAGRSFAEGLARELTAIRLSADSVDDGTGTPTASFPELLGVPDPEQFDLAERWRPRDNRNFLRIPFGVRDGTAEPVYLDFKESAQMGMGPHGLCVGATGSGKSELLRTLVLSLISTHPPERLSMMLVDYKGGAAFAPFIGIPHLAGMITNLSNDSELVERMYASLNGEVLRRQQALADAGRLTDIVEYNLRRDEVGHDKMPPLPNLMVIIDEFGELLTAKPEFSELFLRIGRIGRSIGVHLLLSSQRLEAGKIRGLETYLSYRLGMRTLSEAESRSVIDTPDAYSLPSVPGLGFLKVDVTVYDRFKAAYVSGPIELAEETPAVETKQTGPVGIKAMPPYGKIVDVADVEDDEDADTSTRRTTGPTLLSVIARQIVEKASDRQVSPIWLPPLPTAISLDQAGGGIQDTDDGLRLAEAITAEGSGQHSGGLVIPIGILDDPGRQWQGTWQLDLSAAGGNALILGGPATGKSFLLRTIAMSIAASTTPMDVGIYGIDLLGNGLRPIARLPHVGGVAGRDERERIRRTIEELSGMISARERYFREHQLDTVEDLRKDPNHYMELGCTEVVLMIDGYGQLASEFESLSSQVFDLLARGSRFGIHVIATGRRWNEVRIAQQANFGVKVEFRLTEPAESGINPKLAKTIAKAPPGRAIQADGLIGQVALPRIDGLSSDDVEGTVESCSLISGSWNGPLPPQVRVLPAVLPARDVLHDQPAASVRPGQLVLGQLERDLSPARFDLFGDDQHLLVLGDGDTGKTNLIKLLATQLMEQLSSKELVFAVFDPRRSLGDLVPDEYLGGRAGNPALAVQLAGAISKELGPRSVDPAKAAESPRIVLLLDDYDVLSASGSMPLSSLQPYLASGRDVGLHVIMTRRVMGASRGLYEPFTLGVRESGSLSLLMSGDRGEGQIFPGIRPSILPPGRAQLIRPGDKPVTIQTAFVGDPKEATR